MKRLMLLLIFYATGCAVEAGNPVVDGGKKNGSATLFLAGVPDSFGSFLQFELDSVLLSGVSGEEAILQDLDLVSSSITLDEASSEEAITVAIADDLPEGVYDQVVFALTESPEITYQRKGFDAAKLSLPEKDQRAFYIDADLIVKEGEESEYIISIDIDGSVEGSNEKKTVFRPRGHAIGKKRGLTYEGDTELVSSGVACAYGYAHRRPEPPPEFQREGDRPPPPRPLPKGIAGKPKPYFDSKEDVEKDSDAACQNAFQKVPVVDGGYVFRFLEPATYDIRVFNDEGSYFDVLEGLELRPPAPPPEAELRPDTRW